MSPVDHSLNLLEPIRLDSSQQLPRASLSIESELPEGFGASPSFRRPLKTAYGSPVVLLPAVEARVVRILDGSPVCR